MGKESVKAMIEWALIFLVCSLLRVPLRWNGAAGTAAVGAAPAGLGPPRAPQGASVCSEPIQLLERGPSVTHHFVPGIQHVSCAAEEGAAWSESCLRCRK